MIRLTPAEFDAHQKRLAKLKAAGTVRTHRCEGPAEADREVLGFGHAQELAARALMAGVAAGKASRTGKSRVTLGLPYPPTVNHYWARNRSGGLRIDKAGVAYREAVRQAVRAATAPELAGKLAVEIIACPPDRRRRDLDNLLKATLDALQHAGLYADDNAIDRLSIKRGAMVAKGLLAVTVEQA